MILLKDVTKYYGNTKAVEKISLKISSGTSLVLSGPSGSGKTTLLRLISGLEAVDSGEIYINEQIVSKKAWSLAPHKRNLGFVFQSPALWPHMTVSQNILFGLNCLDKNEAGKRLEEVLERTGLTDLSHRYPGEISGGEARRAALARTIAVRPLYILMDEPLVNLDCDLKNELLFFILEIIKEYKMSLIYVTHDREEGKKISDNVIFIKGGRIVESI